MPGSIPGSPTTFPFSTWLPRIAICGRMIRFLLPLLLAAPAAAQDHAAGDLRIERPYAFATPPSAPVAGGYMVLRNDGEADDVLLEVRVDPGIAGTVQLHGMTMDGVVMRMRERADGIPLPAGETVTLEPGGLHLMFTRLPQGFADGSGFPATLVFEGAGEVTVVFEVIRRGAAPAGRTMHHGGGAHGTNGAVGAEDEDG